MENIGRSSFVRLGAAFALAAAAPSAALAQRLTEVKFAAIPSDIAAEAWYAENSGILKRFGLSAQITPLTNGGAISSAVLGGAADVGYSNVISLVSAKTRGLPITIIAPANLHVASAPTAGIIAVKKSSPYQTGKDLTGKIVGVVGLNNIAHIAAKAWIDKAGGDSSATKFIEISFAEMTAAIDAGRIDAGSLDTAGDPTLGKPDDPLRRIGSAFDAVAPRFAPSVWFTTTDWVTKHPQEAKAVVQALAATATWANAHHKETAPMLAQVTKRSVEQIESLTRVTYGEKVTPDLIQPNVDVAVKYGLLKGPFSAATMISSIAA